MNFYKDGPESDTRHVFHRDAGSTILYVDDDDSDIELMRNAIEKGGDGVALVAFQDPLEALNTCRLSHSAPSLVVLDINMPKMNGIELLKNIHALEHFRGTPVVILSSCCSPEHSKEARELGAVGCWEKPFGSKEFAAVAKAFLEIAKKRP